MSLFGSKTVEEAVANLRKAVSDLESVANAQAAVASSAKAQAVRQEEIAKAALAESLRAERIADKIEELIA